MNCTAEVGRAVPSALFDRVGGPGGALDTYIRKSVIFAQIFIGGPSSREAQIFGPRRCSALRFRFRLRQGQWQADISGERQFAATQRCSICGANRT